MFSEGPSFLLSLNFQCPSFKPPALSCCGLYLSPWYESPELLADFSGPHVHAQSLRCVQLFEALWTVARQALLSMGFPSKNIRVGFHNLLRGIFPTQGSSPHLLFWQVDSLPLSYLGSPPLKPQPQEEQSVCCSPAPKGSVYTLDL